MKRYSAVFFTLVIMMLAGNILTGLSATAEAAPRFFSKPVTFYAERQELTSVLASFARMQGLSASVASSIKGTLSGRFEKVAPDTFLEGLRAAFGVGWYKTGSTLHFYPENESTQAFYSPKVLSAAEIVSMLRNTTVLSPQLPPVLDPNGGMITIKGPPEYIAQVLAAAAALEESFASRMTMKVFPLKYAWADDISVNSMDKTITVPGVASILRAMVTGSATSSSSVTQQPATVPKLGGTGLIAQGRQQEPATVQAQPEARQGTDTGTDRPAANIMSDPRVNAVLIQDAEYRMSYYEKVIQDLDKPVELVEIHAAIVDIDTNFKRDLGINYQFSTGSGDGWQGGGSLSPTGAPFNPTPPMGGATSAGLNLSTIYTKGSEYFLARVQALEEEGGARVLGRPSVLTVDNLQATLENTSTYYLQISGYQAVDLFKVEAGTVLRVTPHIIYDAGGKKSVKLAINVQDNQSDNNSQQATVGVLPPIKQTRINTQAIVGAGQSLLIGGYYYEQKGTTDNGIPVLMHIPVIGNLFKTASKSAKRMERLILITPRVLALEDLPKTPDHVDDPDFARSPTQQNYEPRQAPAVGGCSRQVPRPADAVSGKTGAEARNTL
ncbi:MAG: type III secretion system outer membrane ring subunit SctC [Bilophila sp.]